MQITRKSPITLLEIMIVIFIIGIIGGVIGYNMKGSLDEGRSFKSEQGSKQVYDLLTLKMADGTSLEDILEDPKKALKENGFVNNTKKLLQDGWSNEFELREVGIDNFCVYSAKWHEFLKKKKNLTDEKLQEEYPWAFNFEEEEDDD